MAIVDIYIQDFSTLNKEAISSFPKPYFLGWPSDDPSIRAIRWFWGPRSLWAGCQFQQHRGTTIREKSPFFMGKSTISMAIFQSEALVLSEGYELWNLNGIFTNSADMCEFELLSFWISIVFSAIWVGAKVNGFWMILAHIQSKPVGTKFGISV